MQYKVLKSDFNEVFTGKTAYDYLKTNEEFTKTELFKKLSSQFQQNTSSP